MGKKYTTETFIQKAKSIHGNAYTYLKVNYITSNIDVIITCNIHGDFPQIAASHLQGCGCRLCRIDNSKKSTDDFIKKAINKHGLLYDYSKVIYVDARTDIIINCIKHGDFPQLPYVHLFGSGCNQCYRESRRSSTDEFIEKAKLVHGNLYSYLNTLYVKGSLKVNITCPKHGEFWQTPEGHLAGNHCYKCNTTGYSKSCIAWLEYIMQLENIYIQHAENIGEYRIPNTRYRVDGYCTTNNTVYEFYGDDFHGNPAKHSSDKMCSPKGYKTAGDLYVKTINREQEIKELGYNLVVMWESDYKQLLKYKI